MYSVQVMRKDNNTPVCYMVDWMRWRPHSSREHIEVFRLDFGSCSDHPLLLNGPVIPLAIHTVLSLCISHHCRRQTRAKAAQHLLQAQGGGLSMGMELSLGLVVEIVGPLVLMG